MIRRLFCARPGGGVRLLLIGGAVVASVVGCSGGGDDEPVAQPSTSTGSPTADPTKEPTSEPGRPVTLPLQGQDPCELFTEPLVQEFALRGSPLPETTSAGQPSCQMLAGPPGGYIVTLVTDEGMERFEGIPEDMATVDEMTIAGFPAAELRDVNQPTACLVGIDVADGEHLSVYVTDVPENGTPDDICSNATGFAEALVASIVSKNSSQ